MTFLLNYFTLANSSVGTLHVLNSSNTYQGDMDRNTTIGHYALNGPMNESDGLWVSVQTWYDSATPL